MSCRAVGDSTEIIVLNPPGQFHGDFRSNPRAGGALIGVKPTRLDPGGEGALRKPLEECNSTRIQYSALVPRAGGALIGVKPTRLDRGGEGALRKPPERTEATNCF